ncbi:ABC transporter permease [Ructibacterium gallinarum]|uniref:ABC transporter permease n=1 Tax=Ructibacterium gallinarum TaxID=2779355 RepID=A0A9D5M613_9FIRM|nr:ABC transporter permease [Ructibacterium gallinarum]MBE5040219.1 ABC transporter permease [Ructibacterium gallinarum]
MKKFFVSVINECTKLLHRKKYLVFLLIGIAISLFNVLGKTVVGRLSGGSFNISGSSAPMAMMTLFIEFLIPLVVMMAVCDLFSTEYQEMTMKAVLIRPVSRIKIYASKLTAVTLLALVYLLVLFAASGVLDLLIAGKIRSLGYAFFAYLLDIVPMFVVILMAAFINQIGKGSTLAMFLCIIVYGVLYVAGIFIPNLSGMLFTGYMKWHSLWLGHMLPVGALTAKTALLAGYALVFFSGGYYLFLRREI